MAWVDSTLLLLMVGIPLLGAFFVVLMPDSDHVTLRYVGMGAGLASAAIALRGLWLLQSGEALLTPLALPGISFPLKLRLDAASLPLVLGICAAAPMALRAGAPRVASWVKAYVLLLLLLQSLALGVVLVDEPLAALILFDGLLIPTLLLLGLYGGEHKGSLGLRFGVVQVVTDAFALGAIAATTADATPAREALLATALILVGVTRLGLFPLTNWFLNLIEEAPVALVAVIGGVLGPCAGHMIYRGVALARGEVEASALIAISVLALGGAITAGVAVLTGRDLMRWVGGALVLLGTTASLAMVVGTPGAVANALWLLPVGGIACAAVAFAVDGIERRYLTRDSRELPGLAVQVPGLWRVYASGGLGALGLPLLGVGAILPTAAIEIVRAPSFARVGLVPNLGFFVVLFLLLAYVPLATAFVTHLRRTLTAPRRFIRSPARLRTAQAIRLWIPVLIMLAGGLLARQQVHRTEMFLAGTLRPRPQQGFAGKRFDPTLGTKNLGTKNLGTENLGTEQPSVQKPRAQGTRP